MLERLGPLRLGFDLAPGRSILAQRLHRNHPEEDCADADENSQPAQVIGEAVGFGGEELALALAFAKRGPLAVGDLIELGVEPAARALGRGLVVVADARGAALLG